MLDFIYSGEASIPQDDLADFMNLAHDLKIQGLTRDTETKSQRPNSKIPPKTVNVPVRENLVNRSKAIAEEVKFINNLSYLRNGDVTNAQFETQNRVLQNKVVTDYWKPMTKVKESEKSSEKNLSSPQMNNKDAAKLHVLYDLTPKSNVNINEDEFMKQSWHLRNDELLNDTEKKYNINQNKVENEICKPQMNNHNAIIDMRDGFIRNNQNVLIDRHDSNYLNNHEAMIDARDSFHISNRHQNQNAIKDARDAPIHEASGKIKVINNLVGDSVMEEYNEKVFMIMRRLDQGWACGKCPYQSNDKHHVQEHVGMHVKEFVFECTLCQHSSKTKSTFRKHKSKCK